MNKGAGIIGAVLAVGLVCLFAAAIVSYDWNNNEEASGVPFGLESDRTLAENSINYQMFETWGPITIVLGSVMFGAMIAGVCISKEKESTERGDEE